MDDDSAFCSDIGTDSSVPTSSPRGMKVKRIICRYGVGCTHISDPHHGEKFFHPPCPQLSKEQLRTHYICNECGMAFLALSDLQLHLQRKTAWSNTGLVGCRISCLLDSREWHEGIVLQFHKSGKHYVEFRTNGERRWLDMLKMAFYIVERERYEVNTKKNKIISTRETPDGLRRRVRTNEAKEDLYHEEMQLARLDDEWTFVEDISQHYAFAQSVLFKIYDSNVQETGHKTKGHTSLTNEDKNIVRSARGSLLYGELLPRGVNKALGSNRLRAETASVLFDLGMGTGKVAIQAFLQYSNLEYVYGVELAQGRYNIAAAAALTMVSLLGEDNFEVDEVVGRSITITEKAQPGTDEENIRVLHFEQGNLLDVDNVNIADIIMLETDVPKEFIDDLCALLRDMGDGARTLSYLDLKKHWTKQSFTLRQLSNNKNLSDRYSTSWSVQRGHHFYLFQQPHGAKPKWKTGLSMGMNMNVGTSSIISKGGLGRASRLAAVLKEEETDLHKGQEFLENDGRPQYGSVRMVSPTGTIPGHHRHLKASNSLQLQLDDSNSKTKNRCWSFKIFMQWIFGFRKGKDTRNGIDNTSLSDRQVGLTSHNDSCPMDVLSTDLELKSKENTVRYNDNGIIEEMESDIKHYQPSSYSSGRRDKIMTVDAVQGKDKGNGAIANAKTGINMDSTRYKRQTWDDTTLDNDDSTHVHTAASVDENLLAEVLGKGNENGSHNQRRSESQFESLKELAELSDELASCLHIVTQGSPRSELSSDFASPIAHESIDMNTPKYLNER
jgi:hypothetical protein